MITREAWLRDEYDIADLIDEMMEYNDYGLDDAGIILYPSSKEVESYIESLPSEGDLAADHAEAD